MSKDEESSKKIDWECPECKAEATFRNITMGMVYCPECKKWQDKVTKKSDES